MTRTKYVEIDNRGFWALDDALDVWLAYLVEEASEARRIEAWLNEFVADWRRVSALPDIGVTMRLPEVAHRHQIHNLAEAARRRVVAAGDVSVERLRQWTILGNLVVSEGFSRTPDGVTANRILEVADGFIGLLAETLPADPPHGWWYLGTGMGMRVIERRTDY